MKLSRRFQWTLGFLFGLLAPVFAMVIFVEMYPALKTVRSWADPAWKHLVIQITTFGVIMNAGMFFVALRLNKERVANGVMVICIIYLILLVVMQIMY